MACRAVRLQAIALLALAFAACGPFRPSLDSDINAGRLAVVFQQPRAALPRLERSVARHPSWALAHLWHGRALEELARFDAAAAAYRRALELEPSASHHLHAGRLAARLGETTRATVLLGEAARAGASWLRRPAALLLGAVSDPLLRALIEWIVNDAAGEAMLRTLLGAGDEAGAQALAHGRGWLETPGGYCPPTRPDLSPEAHGLLAMLGEAGHGDCLFTTGVALVEAGDIRLARRVLAAALARAPTESARERTARFLRHRLPGHDVPPLAEALTVAGVRLQYAYGLSVEARTAYDAALAVDPAFSWPYRHIGQIWEDREEPQEAIVWHRRSVTAHGNDSLAHLARGRVAQRVRRYDEAVAAFRSAIALDPSAADGHAGLGIALLALGREAEGLAALDQALARDPDHHEARVALTGRRDPGAPGSAAAADPGGHLALARELWRAGRVEEAAAAARQGAAASPQSAVAQTNAADYEEVIGDFAAAARWHAAAERLAPTDPTVLETAGAFASRVGERERALALAERIRSLEPWSARRAADWLPESASWLVLARHPNLMRAARLRVDVLLDAGRLDEARVEARRHALVRRGVDYCSFAREHLKGIDDASREQITQAFTRVVLAQPEQADCIWWFGQWLTDEGQVRLAQVMVREAKRSTPGSHTKAFADQYLRVRLSGGREVARRAESLALVARRLRERSEHVISRRLLEEAVRVDPGFVSPYNQLARLAWEQGDHARALEWLDQALAADPESWRTRRNLGMMLTDLERPAEAEPHLIRARGMFEDDLGVRLTLARVLFALGQHDRYATETRRALEVGSRWGQPLADVRAFLDEFERRGPGRALPPVSAPRVMLGWNRD